MTFPITKTEIAQAIVHTAIALKMAEVAKEQLSEHTEMDPDGIPIKILAATAGYAASGATAPVTDKAIETIVDKFTTWNENRKKKNDESE